MESECWEMGGHRMKGGYVHIMRGGRRMLAHRMSYELHYGPIPDGLLVLHRCDNAACVRPTHLFLGTHRDNTTDMVEKGRHSKLKQTHCKYGHPFTPENTYVRKNGHRQCRACGRRLDRIRYLRYPERRKHHANAT